MAMNPLMWQSMGLWPQAPGAKSGGGMTGLEWAMIANMGANLLGGLFGGDDGQELTPFDGRLSAPNLLGGALDKTNDVFNLTKQRAGEDISLPSAFVQQPGGFSGGGLPFDIGLSGRDQLTSGPTKRGVQLRPPTPTMTGNGRPGQPNVKSRVPVPDGMGRSTPGEDIEDALAWLDVLGRPRVP